MQKLSDTDLQVKTVELKIKPLPVAIAGFELLAVLAAGLLLI